MKKLCHKLLEIRSFSTLRIILLTGLLLIRGEVSGEVLPLTFEELTTYADQIVIGKVDRKVKKPGNSGPNRAQDTYMNS